MKTLLLAIALVSAPAFAHEIKGTLILKGTAKTKVMVDGVEAKCSVKVDEVKNTMTEDSFGNPAYRVWTKVQLSGSDMERSIKVDHEAAIRFVNIAKAGSGTAVSDENYIGENEARAKLTIDEKGRIRSVVFPVGANLITCKF